eukprot:TRINITY_DN4288_c0_g2_i1.p1 TRINITY_DN4288_c0_g2~~TRINITY_DN4288_c0_g2_i1.p1  ORF type:complete len:581 (+),score=112.79 TRINITY_DN4288_c0_g2_i1:218-1744(+)
MARAKKPAPISLTAEVVEMDLLELTGFRKEDRAVGSDAAAARIPLPFEAPKMWERFAQTFQADVPRTVSCLAAALEACELPDGLKGLKRMFKLYPGSEEIFFGSEEGAEASVLAVIAKRALRLPDLIPDPSDRGLNPLWVMHQFVDSKRCVSREIAASVVANMFFSTFNWTNHMTIAPFNTVSFQETLSAVFPHEVAKVRMIVEYFRIIGLTPLTGDIHLYRSTSAVTAEELAVCSAPVTAMRSMAVGVSLERSRELAGRPCLEADFANAYIGGGVLSGGCVQEEIRFAVAPENIVSCLLCPCMQDGEAIQIIGARIYSDHSGYGLKLQFRGPAPPPPAHTDSTDLIAIAAIDALDGRGSKFPVSLQLREDLMLRELCKAHSGYAAHDDRFPVVATGNWGCGVFGGNHELKAVLQWLAACIRGREVHYYPFDVEHLGPGLEKFTQAAQAAGASVGQVWRAVQACAKEVRSGKLHVRERPDFIGDPSLLECVLERLEGGSAPAAAAGGP